MKKVLFLIHDLGQGGAEKVLVNLVNNLDCKKFDITLLSMFAGGVNETFLKQDIQYITAFPKMIPGNSFIMKLFSPKLLHRFFVRDNYDLEVSYLEGPSARVVSGCPNMQTKLCCWIHSNHYSKKEIAASFRNFRETVNCYKKFQEIICVSEYIKNNFMNWIPVNSCRVLYNTIETDTIREKSVEPVPALESVDGFKIAAVGSLKAVKGFDRLLRIVNRLKEKHKGIRLYLFGIGPLESEFKKYIDDHRLGENVFLMGYQVNPYKYVSKCDLLVCSSYSEGFSTAVTEALIVGTPVCTVDVSGMKEMLGENNEYGVVVPNDDDSLYEGIKRLIEDPDLLAHYRKQAENRGRMFSTESTVKSVENMLEKLYENGR